MLTYPDLVQRIVSIQGGTPAAAPEPALDGQWQPTVVDTGSSSQPTAKLPVLVAFGANYGTGLGHLPQASHAIAGKGSPWVEYSLKSCRRRAMDHLKACANRLVKTHWNGLLPYDIDQPDLPPAMVQHLGDTPHFIMTNACPWMTRVDWAAVRDGRLEDIFTLLSQGGMQPSYWGYFKQLKKQVGSDAVWIGHGNADIYGLFRLLCWQLEIKNWFFDSNLSQKSQMLK